MKKKIGLLIGYRGSGYHGLQYSKGLRTIEGEIMEILLECGCITEMNAVDPQKIDLKSSSRTDKGVHASLNVLSVKINWQEGDTNGRIDNGTANSVVDDNNSKSINNIGDSIIANSRAGGTDNIRTMVFRKLREAFRQRGMILYKMVILTKSFVSYKQARSRVYKYIVPTFFLQEESASEVRARSKEESYAVQKRMKTMEGETRDTQDVSTSNDNIGRDGSIDRDNTDIDRTNKDSSNSRRSKDNGIHFFKKYTINDIEPLKGFKEPEGSVQVFREIMKMYLGTHDFHNFTVTKGQGDVRRHMMAIDVSEPFVSGDIEYVEVTIHGQSFMLHQIRKMISFAVLNCKFSRQNYRENFLQVFSPSNKRKDSNSKRNNSRRDNREDLDNKRDRIEEINTSNEDDVEDSNEENNCIENDVHVPKCPSAYLFLGNVLFDDYNKAREAPEKIEVSEGKELSEKMEFEKNCVYPAVLKDENIYEWLMYFESVRFHFEKLIFK